MYCIETPWYTTPVKKLIEKYNDLLSNKYDTATQGEFKWLAPTKLTEHIKPYIRNNLEVLDIGVGTVVYFHTFKVG